MKLIINLLDILIGNLSMEDIFTDIYNQSSWGTDHRNGPGSTMAMTHSIRMILKGIISKYQIKSIVDAGCGSYSWIDPVITPDIEYIGIDIVKKQIEDNIVAHLKSVRSDSTQVQPNKNLRFQYGNLIDQFPQIARNKDLIVCKHLTQHLTSDSTLKILANFKTSGCKYLLITNYDVGYNSEDCQWKSLQCPALDAGACRQQNLVLFPYSLPGLIEQYPKYSLFKLND
jgi:hypothetical protein